VPVFALVDTIGMNLLRGVGLGSIPKGLQGQSNIIKEMLEVSKEMLEVNGVKTGGAMP